jgi:HEAT repeat protein
MMSRLRKHALFIAVCGSLICAGAAAWAAEPSVKELLDALKSTDAATRLNAIDQLGAQGAKAAEAVPALAELLKDDSATVRRRAVQALLAIRPGPKVMLPLFIQLMEDSDPGVRMRILNATAEAGEAAVPGLINALKNEKTAYWACIVLHEIGPNAKEAVPALVEKLKDPRPDIRREAVLALGAINEAALPVLPQIAAVLDDKDTDPRTAATFVLGELKQIPADAEAKIRKNAKSDDRFLSTVSLWTLARIHPEDKELRRQTTEQLFERLKDTDPHVGSMAARALASLPPAPEITLPLWEKSMKNADAATLRNALDALATLGAPAVPRLIEFLDRKEIRVNAIFILGQIGPEAAPAIGALSKLIADDDRNVATEAVLALGKIGPAAKAAVPALIESLQKENCPNAHAVIFTLGKIGPDAAAAEPLILKAMLGEDHSLASIGAWALTQLHPGSKEHVAKAVHVLVICLSDPLPDTRKAAAEALGKLGVGAKDAVPDLEKAAKDHNQAVRDAAVEALKLMTK